MESLRPAVQLTLTKEQAALLTPILQQMLPVSKPTEHEANTAYDKTLEKASGKGQQVATLLTLPF